MTILKRYFNKFGFFCLLVPLLVFNSLWIISYFKVVPYSIARQYVFVVDWIKKNFPEDRKDKFLIADNYQTASVQLISGVGDPNPPGLVLTNKHKEIACQIKKKFPVEDYIKKHDQSIYYRIYENRRPYVKSILNEYKTDKNILTDKDFNSFPCSVPLLYSIRNFHEILLTVSSYPSSQPRPRIIEYDGFPKYAVEKTNIQRLERNGTLFLSRKAIFPESESIKRINNISVYDAKFSKLTDIQDIELVFGIGNKSSTILATIEYKSENSVWRLLGEKPILLIIDERGVGRITADPDAYKLERGYNALYFIKDRLSRVGQLQFEKWHKGMDPGLVSLPDDLRKIMELRITLFPSIPTYDEDIMDYIASFMPFLKEIKDFLRTVEIVNLSEVKIRASEEYENYGYYTGIATDIRPHKKDTNENFAVTAEINADISPQTEIQVMLRFSNDLLTWTEWSGTVKDKNLKGTYLVDIPADFFQYKLILLSNDSEQTPAIRGLRFSFCTPYFD